MEVEFKIVAHIVSRKTADCGCCDEEVTARIVLRDEDGFNRAVLATGTDKDEWNAVEQAVSAFESSFRAIRRERVA